VTPSAPRNSGARQSGLAPSEKPTLGQAFLESPEFKALSMRGGINQPIEISVDGGPWKLMDDATMSGL
jgi:hypothetical protein